MHRRGVLVGVGAALGGCLLPAADPPADLPDPPPRVYCNATWGRERLTLRVVGGHPITGDWARNLTVAGTAEGISVWASTTTEGRGSFPVEPGDSIVVPVGPDTDTVRLDVVGTDAATTLCRFERRDR